MAYITLHVPPSETCIRARGDVFVSCTKSLKFYQVRFTWSPFCCVAVQRCPRSRHALHAESPHRPSCSSVTRFRVGMVEAELNVVVAFSLAVGGGFNAANIAGVFLLFAFPPICTPCIYIYTYIIGFLFTLVK